MKTGGGVIGCVRGVREGFENGCQTDPTVKTAKAPRNAGTRGSAIQGHLRASISESQEFLTNYKKGTQ